ncbi:MAG: aspartate kinase [Proteobacteria bacterium]|nr:aspartate kinase [Pseudomonadota bacterium]
MEFVIQKFGGTSIGRASRMKNVASIIETTIASGEQPVVVLSAMSDSGKKEGTTSRLMNAAREAINGGSYYKIIDQIEIHHLDVVNKIINDLRIRIQLEDEIREELQKLKSFLDAIQVIGEISQRSMDVIISSGEKLSARIFSALLNSMGIDSDFINLDNLVDKPFKEIDKRFCSYLQKKLGTLIKKSGARIPVVTGFFGFVPNGILKSIGRGYTDFTASLIAVGVKANELQIWKEVDGIFTADPNKVSSARVLKSVSPDEASELTYFGSEVIHPFTMEQVINADIPVRIKNTFDPTLDGTTIVPGKGKQEVQKGPTAVTVKRDVTLINIQSNRMLMAYGFMSRVFDVFNRHEIVIDLISTSEVNVSLTIAEHQNLKPVINELKQLGEVTVRNNLAILSLVGQGMQHTLGIAGEMFSKLAKEGVNIEVISQGASEINISCAIKDKDSDKALKAVHQMLV